MANPLLTRTQASEATSASYGGRSQPSPLSATRPFADPMEDQASGEFTQAGSGHSFGEVAISSHASAPVAIQRQLYDDFFPFFNPTPEIPPGITLGNRPAEGGASGPYAYSSSNDSGTGLEWGVGLASARDEEMGASILSAEGKHGEWEENGETRYGHRMSGGVGKSDFNFARMLGLPPEVILSGDLGGFTASAEASVGTDGASLGAQANFVEGSITAGTSSAESNTDEIGRLGLSAGGGLAGRLHWGDRDNDGFREYGFGFDYGPLSMDLKTEDPLRTGLGIVPLGLLDPLLPEGNLTEGLANVFGLTTQDATLEDTWNLITDTASDAWDWTSDTASDAWDTASGAASDAWDWTSDTASDAWDTASGAASDAWDWLTD